MSTLAPTLLAVRGLPGSGKSSLALQFGEAVVSADDYFNVGGIYRFDLTKLGAAHADCQARCRGLLESGMSVAVANTFTEAWEIAVYVRIAAETGARFVVVDCFDGGMTDEELARKNVHGVPQASLATRRARWVQDGRAGEQRAPWDRG